MAYKKYAYYNKGNKIALIEQKDSTSSGTLAVAHCTLSAYTTKDTCEANGGQWIPSSSSSMDTVGEYKSPVDTIADGLEIEYTYAPTYRIQTTNDVDANITQYMSTDGKLTIADNTSTYINYATTYALAADKYIVLEKAGRFNGLHKIESIGDNTGTNNKIILTTKYTGSESTWTDFEETPDLYYALDVMEDESFDLDLTRYQANAVVYYLQAKKFEDACDIERHEYYMAKFRKQLEKASGSRKSGPHVIQGHWNMRRK